MKETQRIFIAITRKARAGKEAEFESALLAFLAEASNESSTDGHFLLRPTSPEGSEYGIIRSFASRESQEAFYRSPTFQKWLKTVEPLVEGEPVMRELNGFESFFRMDAKSAPPRWKMAIIVWMGVFPSALLWSSVIPPILGSVPHLLRVAIVNAAVVATLTWLVMPVLTNVFHSWLSSHLSPDNK